MSGDVQPRKRKDKKRKRDALDRKSEGEVIFSRHQSFQDDDESSHGVHITKMAGDDVHLHVHEDHGTGGHWCAKILFFGLLAVLLGLVGLIILENRGLTDLDTPLSESRFSNYFDGWVDENREEHDEHDAVQASIEEHDEHDEPFEEEEDHSEVDEDHDDEDHDDEDDHDDEEDEEEDDEEGDNVTEEATAEQTKEDDDDEEDEEDDNVTAETLTKEADDDDDDEDNEDEDEEDNATKEQSKLQTNEEDDDDEVDDNTAAEEDTNEQNNDNDDADEEDDDEENVTKDAEDQTQEDDNDDNNNNNDDDNDDDDEVDESVQATTASQQSNANSQKDDDNDDAFDEDDDDGTFESLENVVDNDAEELLLLQEKARQQAAEASKNAPDTEEDNDDEEAAKAAPSWGSSQIKPKQTLGGDPEDDDDDDGDNDFDLFEQELRKANEEMMRERFAAASEAFTQLSQKHPDKPQAFLGQAKSLDHLSTQQRSNRLLSAALEAYKRYLAFGSAITNDVEYRAAAERCIERMRFMGLHMQAVPIHEQLIERFPDEPLFRNQLAVTYLMSNRLADAKRVLQQTLSRWPTDGFAQVHYGFVLKQHDQDYENAISYLQHGIASQAEGTQDGRFFFNLGDALQRLGRSAEALAVYKRGAELQLFPSVYQRSLYNEPHLRAQPFWSKEETTYAEFLNKMEQNWLAIRDEGLSVLSRRGYFLDESENLRDSGDWKQFELYARGQRRAENCQKAPITCGLITSFRAASGCRRGQVKFSVMHPGTHVWPHCGPTNCRLRAHLGLVVPAGTRLRVADEERTWTEGKFLIFDDSFEHEVWHEGNSLRLVLIVDFWHPDLSEQQRQSLTPI